MPAVVSDETIHDLRRTLDTLTDGRAHQALEALAAIRDDRALLHIHAVAAQGKGKLGKRATQILEEVCRQRGLSADELEDRIVPELGLDERGTMMLDYGPRRFTVGFDEQLEPFVRDEAGIRLAAIPHVAKTDDEAKAKQAHDVWKGLKDAVKTIGSQQARRLERSMCAQRRWTAAAFATFLVKHRLLGHFSRRLVFGVVDGPAFHVAEDGTYADADERALAIAPDAKVVIVHPTTLDEPTRARWRQIFEDYEILQPFPQVDRELPKLDDAELHGTTTQRFAGIVATSRRFWGLKHRGWELAYAPTKRIDARTVATLSVSPGLAWYAHGSGSDEEHTLGELIVRGKTFAALSAIDRVELLRDVELLRA